MDSSDTTASQQSSRRSTLIYTTDITFISTAILDPHPSTINSSSSEGFSSPEVASPPSLPTKGHNKTLKPLSSLACSNGNSNDNRNSIGYWSGTKTAASTPNLMNLSKNSDFFGSYPLQGSASGKGAMTTPSTPTTPTGQSPCSPKPGFGGRLRSGSMSASASGTRSTPCGQGVASSGSSIHHRRKRSESIGGIKSTAGNITRMVRKSSSSFLRKLAKSFDDKDAPPIPMLPSHNNNSTVSHQSESSASITNSIVSTTATTPLVSSDLSILSEKRSSGLVGPLDMLPVDDEDDMESSIHTDSPVSPTGAHHKQQYQEHLLHPGFAAATRPISIPRPLSRTSGLDIEVDEELSNSVSTVESWLRKTHSGQEKASARASSPSTSTTTTTTTTATATITTATTITTTTATGDLNDATTIAELATHSSLSPTNLTKHPEAIPVPLTTAAKFSLLAQTIRRPSHASSVSTMDDDSESEDIPIPIQSVLTTLNSNRLSRLFEATGSPISLQPYYSTKAALSLSEGEPQQQDSSQGERGVSNGTLNGNRGSRMSLVADFKNSIRFSEFGLMAPNKDLPSVPDSSLQLEKPLPHRPISLLATPGTLAFSMLDNARDDEGGGVDNRSRTPASSGHSSPALLYLSPDTSPTESYPGQGSTAAGSNRLEVPRNTTAGGNGARPATICIGAEDSQQAAQVPGAISVLFIPLTMDTQPVEEQREETTESLAQRTSRRCFQEDESFLRRDEISIYLGQAKSFNQLVLRYYMSNFDFSGKRVDVAFRQLCQKLMLRGETQEVDRVLEGFAERYVDCNPESIFGSKDVVHAVTYSILLLNTDLHVVQQSSANKMSRSAFVKNTLQAVRAQTLQQQEDDERASEDSSTHGLPLTRTTTGDTILHGSCGKKRTPSIKSWKSGASFQNRNAKMGTDPKANGGYGNGKWWMSELETLLKDIYSTVKNNQILLPTTTPTKPTSKSVPNTPVLTALPHSTSSISLSSTRSATGGSSFLPRLPKPETPPHYPSGSGNFGGSGNNSGGSIFSALGRRSSMNFKSKQRLNAQALVEAASSASPPLPSPSRFGYVEDGSGIAPQSCSRPGNSSHGPAPALTPPSSFISQRNQMTSSPLPSPVSNVFLYQDTQGCSSPNSSSVLQQESKFRMEGYLFRKHLLERTDKKASHRTWRRLLVVLDQGGLWMFRADGQMGQGYEEQGVLYDEIRLQHTITNILPPPGYSSSRRHVFAVQLHSGAVYLFQTASADECEQWARNCNYWAARTSKEPLSGGVINMDYGWGRCLDLLANSPEPAHSNTMSSTTSGYSISSLSSGSAPYSSSSNVSTPMTPPSSGRSTTTSDDNDTSSAQTGIGYLSTPPPPLSSPSTSSFSSAIQAYPSMMGAENIASVNNGGRASSMKSTTSRHGGGAGMPMSPGDRVTLFEWTPPLPTMSMSSLGEEEQCKSLKRYVAGLEADMEVHQDHRIPMTRLFLPRTPNFVKAFNNWERRSRHLLKEMVKYQIYVECLEQSIRHRRLDQEDGTEDLDTELQHLEVDDDDDDYHRQHHHYTHTHDREERDV
ncbi:MAG: hypothetical protein J3Q66DRAFT_343356 [Benniella sp.]|nr:MAG: hypothetical protein J3Q66DRAFT_343356 [Benniella sp.]